MGFLEGKVIIYYNNVNMYGTVDNVFEEIVMRYAVSGSIIMCYRSIFRHSNTVQLVSENEVEVGTEHFSWYGCNKTITVWVYEVL